MLPVPKEEYDRFRELLVKMRKKAGLTQVELGTKLGQPQTVISKIERGARRIDLLEFLEMAKAIGFDPTVFIRRLRSK